MLIALTLITGKFLVIFENHETVLLESRFPKYFIIGHQGNIGQLRCNCVLEAQMSPNRV